MRRLFMACVLATFIAPAAWAAEHEVLMLTKGPEGQRNWFEPPIVRAEPGDTIHFVATDKGHNSTAMVVPDGAEAWTGKISQDVTVTLDVPGLYSYKCTPHLGLGMVGLVVVGDPSINLDAVAGGKYPGKAKATMTELLKELKASM